MQSYQSEERIILRELFENKAPLSFYFFHKKYLLSPAQIDEVINAYSCRGIIKKKLFRRAQLTAHGRKWVIENRNYIFKSVNKYWKDIPAGIYLSEKIEAGRPILPNRKKVDKNFFLSLSGKGRDSDVSC